MDKAYLLPEGTAVMAGPENPRDLVPAWLSEPPDDLAPDSLASLVGRNDDHGKVAIRDVVAQCSAEAYNGGAFPRNDGSVGLLHHDPESVCVADPGLPSDRGEECPDWFVVWRADGTEVYALHSWVPLRDVDPVDAGLPNSLSI